MNSAGPRWKGKGFNDIASANPISEIVKELQSSLRQSNASAILSGSDVLLEVGLELANLLNRTCFGQPLLTSEKDKQWFQFGPEEAFYMSHALQCLAILGEDDHPKNGEELWEQMKSEREEFPFLYKAYSHLRTKNWIVRPGIQYGVDYVAYRHHPALVHSEYSIVVLPEGEPTHPRLKIWSDWQCALRVTGGVAKNLLVLNIKSNGCATTSPSCLEKYTVTEHVMARWVPEQSREETSGSVDRIQLDQDAHVHRSYHHD